MSVCRYCVRTVHFGGRWQRLIHEIKVHGAPVPSWMETLIAKWRIKDPRGIAPKGDR